MCHPGFGELPLLQTALLKPITPKAFTPSRVVPGPLATKWVTVCPQRPLQAVWDQLQPPGKDSWGRPRRQLRIVWARGSLVLVFSIQRASDHHGPLTPAAAPVPSGCCRAQGHQISGAQELLHLRTVSISCSNF